MKNFNRSTAERYFYLNPRKILAFTMAEILLSLTIIGVVAAITLPSLTGNINERTWNTQRKALYARMSQAIMLMPALNGYGTLKEESSAGASDAVDTAAETFVTAGLAKVLKINNICDNDHLDDCGFVSSYTDLNGSTKQIAKTLFGLNSLFSTLQIDTKAVAFETGNGESVIVYYNPQCQPYMNETSGSHYVQGRMCANFIYDLNGSKGPNTIGKDMGVISALYPTDSIVVAPLPINKDVIANQGFSAAKKECNENDSRIPNIYELKSMFYNKDIFGIPSYTYMSSTYCSVKDQTVWALAFAGGFVHEQNAETVNGSRAIRCVRR